MRWPFRRTSPDRSAATLRQGPPPPPRREWATLPSIEPVVGPAPLVAQRRAFHPGLAGAGRLEPALARLGHQLRPDAPRGMVGLAARVTVAPAASLPPLRGQGHGTDWPTAGAGEMPDVQPVRLLPAVEPDVAPAPHQVVPTASLTRCPDVEVGAAPVPPSGSEDPPSVAAPASGRWADGDRPQSTSVVQRRLDGDPLDRTGFAPASPQGTVRARRPSLGESRRLGLGKPFIRTVQRSADGFRPPTEERADRPTTDAGAPPPVHRVSADEARIEPALHAVLLPAVPALDLAPGPGEVQEHTAAGGLDAPPSSSAPADRAVQATAGGGAGQSATAATVEGIPSWEPVGRIAPPSWTHHASSVGGIARSTAQGPSLQRMIASSPLPSAESPPPAAPRAITQDWAPPDPTTPPSPARRPEFPSGDLPPSRVAVMPRAESTASGVPQSPRPVGGHDETSTVGDRPLVVRPPRVQPYRVDGSARPVVTTGDTTPTADRSLSGPRPPDAPRTVPAIPWVTALGSPGMAAASVVQRHIPTRPTASPQLRTWTSLAPTDGGPAVTGADPGTPAPSTDVSAAVQREVTEMATTAPLETQGAAAAPPTGAGGPAGERSEGELQELARQLYEHIGTRLRSELLLERERAGLLTDLR
jgi:hypothetical protein